jgi:DNA polymerase
MIFGTPVGVTINACTDFRKFQKIVKLSNKYSWVEHENGQGNTKFDNKAYRVFASRSHTDGRLLKCDGVRNPAKFGNTPDRCFIFNDDLRGVSIPDKLDRQYYIGLAKKRLEDFGL